MADDVGMINSRYRLVSLTFNEKPFELAASAQSARIPVVFVEAPSAALFRVKTNVLTMKELPLDLAASLSAARISMVIAPPPATITAVRHVAIITHTEQGTPTYTTQNFEQVMSATPYVPAEYVFSMLSDRMVAQHALQKADKREWPVSNIHNGQSAMLALHDTLAVMPASLSEVYQVAQLELRSLVEEHVPVSMNYERQFAEKVLIAKKPDPMYSGSSMLHSVAEKVLRSIPPVGPIHSMTKTPSVINLALIANPLPLYIGDTYSYGVVSMALTGKSSELPISPSESHSTVSMALLGYKPENGQSESVGAATVENVLIDAVDLYHNSTVGEEDMASVSQRVLMASYYHPPNGMSGANLPQSSEMVLVENIKPMPKVSAHMSSVGLEWLIGSHYPTPEEMLPPEKVAISASASHCTLMAMVVGNPISTMVMPSSSLLTVMSQDVLPPEEMLNTGMFVKSVGLQVAEPAEYESAKSSFSTLTSGAIYQAVALPDNSFPDKSLSTSTLTAGMAVSCVAVPDTTFPDKNNAYSTLAANAVYEVVTINDDSFPPKDGVVSFLKVSLAGSVTAFQDNDWPPKNMVQSHLRADSISQVVAVSAVYPDKSTPESSVLSNMVGHVVAVKDTSMYVMPERSIRRRPFVSVTIVY